jgi:hypothetical protein
MLIPFAFAMAGRPFPVTPFSYDLNISHFVFNKLFLLFDAISVRTYKKLKRR